MSLNNLSQVVEKSLSLAQTFAHKGKCGEIYPGHFLLALAQNPNSRLSKSVSKEFNNKVETIISTYPNLSTKPKFDQMRLSSDLQEWCSYASGNAVQESRDEVTENDFLKFIPQFFKDLKLDELLIAENNEDQEVPSFLIDLNELAKQGKLDPVIGRTKEIRALMEILGRRSKNNPVLVGEAGVGKTAIVEGLAESIIKGDITDFLANKTIYSLDLGALMAGTKFRGEFEERLQNLLSFIKTQNGKAILFIDELHQLVGAGKTDGAMDAANLLKPALARGDLHCIGATTNDEYQKHILGDAALDRRFRPVQVNEPTVEDAVQILTGIRDKLEIHHGIKISDESILHSVKLSKQYIPNKQLPDKAIDLIDEAASALKLSVESMPTNLSVLESELKSKKIFQQMEGRENKKLEKEIQELEQKFQEDKGKWESEVLVLKKISELKNKKDKLLFDLEKAERNQDYETAGKIKFSLLPEIENEINSKNHDWVLKPLHVAQVISREKKIPIEKILKSKQEQILKLEQYLNTKVFGQENALNEIAEVLISSHAGLKDDSKPLGSFLLKGPSGVGKTETAKALCEFLFGDFENLIRFDLSEFSEKHSIAKLIGAPAGYVGYEEGGVLTEAIRKHPYSVVLFDEIEKAHDDFADVLLQILDDGRLQDSKGRSIDFKNTIVLITTNSKDLNFDFKPEVLGRIDSILDYKPIDDEITDKLVDKELSLLNQRLELKNIKVKLSSKIREKIKSSGVNERWGARPLSSEFNRIVIRPLSKELIKNNLKENHHYQLDLDEDNNLVIQQ